MITSRPYKPGDEKGIVQLYNEVTGRNRTMEQHRWEWLHAPEGQGSIWVILYDEPDGSCKIVGHHGLIAIRFCFFGEAILAGKTENTMVYPQYTKKILYFRFEKLFFKESKKRFDLLYTTDGAGSPGKIRRALGYIPVGRYTTYIRVTKKSCLDSILTSLLKKTIKNGLVVKLCDPLIKFFNYFLILFFFCYKNIDNKVTLKKIDNPLELKEGWDEFWERNKGYLGITVDRNLNYIKWRIFDNPNVRYEVFAAEKNNRLVGYTVLESKNHEHIKIIDIVSDNQDPLIFAAILNGIEHYLQNRSIFIISLNTLLSQNLLNKSLKKNGFRHFNKLVKMLNKFAKNEEPFLLVKPVSNVTANVELTNPVNWYYTDIFREGL